MQPLRRDFWTQWGKEGGVGFEIIALKYTLLSVKQIASGNLLYDARKSNLVLCDNLGGGMGWEVGRMFMLM